MEEVWASETTSAKLLSANGVDFSETIVRAPL